MTPARYLSLWAAIVFPSLAIVEKYLGWPGMMAYAAGAGLALAGESPYTQTTYLGDGLHQLPGAFLLAAPFVIAGTSALQNLFWLPLFFVAIGRATRDPRDALALAWLVLALSPEVMHQLVTGGSYPSNAISVLLCLWWMAGTRHWVAALVWGVALASRANFLFLIPVAFGWLHHRFGLRSALQLIGLASATVAALSLPFYLNHPVNFGPLQAGDRLLRFDTLLPHTGIALMVLTGALAIALGRLRVDLAGLFRNCAFVLAFPVVAGFVLSSWAAGRLDPEYAPYGLFFSWFALLALSTQPIPPEPSSPRYQSTRLAPMNRLAQYCVLN